MLLLVRLLHRVRIEIHEVALLVAEVDGEVDEVDIQHVAVVVAQRVVGADVNEHPCQEMHVAPRRICQSDTRGTGAVRR